MPKQSPNPSPEPRFSAGNVRSGVYSILHDLSDVEVEDELTLSDLGVAPITVRRRVNTIFFPDPHAGLGSSQVTASATVFRLISTTIHKLEDQGRLRA